MKQTKQQAIQLSLFDDTVQSTPPKVNRPRGGSQNPIVFHDYESYIAKFQEKEKTTDDTYTPKDVYEAVLTYVGEIYPLEGKQILRPFYPGGDYENAEYPEDGVVIDNPPFSIYTKICRFYSERGIPFFLFVPGLVSFSVLGFCSVVVVGTGITFENKANVTCAFATNLIGDTLAMSSVRLTNLIKACPSQNIKANLAKYAYPDELIGVSDFQTIARGNEDFSIRKDEAHVTKNLDFHPKGSNALFGNHLLVSKAAAAKAAAAKAAAAKAAAAKAAAKAAAINAIPVMLSEREKNIVEALGLNSLSEQAQPSV